MKLIHVLGTLALIFALGFVAAPASAQAARTWVSGVGDDLNPCSRTAPCKTFAGAISKTAAGGEINCLDPGGYGSLTITKSLSIICSAGEGGILGSGASGITIVAGSSDQINLGGLDLEGIGIGIDGIDIQSAGEVVIKNCNIHQFAHNGVLIATSSLIRVIIRDSTIGENGDSGVVVNSTPGFGHVRIFDSMIFTNINDGVQVNGSGNEALLSNVEVLGNHRQLNISSGVSGGIIYSVGNNVIPSSYGDSPTLSSLK